MPRAEIPESVERWYLVRCGECGFIGDPELGHCAKCGYDGIDPASEGLEVMRIADAHKQISEVIAPALHAHWLEQLKEELLSEVAIEAAKDELRPPPGDYMRGFYVREAFRAALASISIEEGIAAYFSISDVECPCGGRLDKEADGE